MKKILFVEDEPDQIALVKMRLESNGFKFVSAMDGEEGLKKVYEEKPDLILLDLLMPKMTGDELCRIIKEDEKTKHIPIIVLTAYGAEDLEEKCLVCGAYECIRKPYDSKALVEKIKKILSKK